MCSYIFRSEVDVDILDEVNLVQMSHDLNSKGDNKTDDTNLLLGKFRESGREKKVGEKFRKARPRSPYSLVTRHLASGLRPNSAPSFMKSDVDLQLVDIPLGRETCLSSNKLSVQNSDARLLKNGDVECHLNGAIPKTPKTENYAKVCEREINAKYASSPNLCSHDQNIPYHQQNCTGNHLSSSNFASAQRKHSVTSLSSRTSSQSQVSDSDPENATQIYKVESSRGTPYQNVSRSNGHLENGLKYKLDQKEKTGEQDRLHEFNHHVSESTYSQMGESLVETKKGKFRPTVSSPRIKEKRLKLKNILKNKKGSFVPSEDMVISPADERNVNRIYAKSRGDVYGKRMNKGGNSGKNSDLRLQGEVTSREMEAQRKISSDISETEVRKSPCVTELESESGSCVSLESRSHDEKSSNEFVRTDKEQYSGHGDVRDTESIDNFISGANVNTLTAKPVLVNRDARNGGGRTLPQTPDSNPGQVTENVHTKKASPPKKPARTKNKNKNLPPDLNLSKYKIKPGSSSEHCERASPQSAGSLGSAGSSDVNSQSDLRILSHDQRVLDGEPEHRTGDLNSGHQAVMNAAPRHQNQVENEIEIMPLQRRYTNKKMFELYKKIVFVHIYMPIETDI